MARFMFEYILVLSLNEAQSKCEAWWQDYNKVLPHSSIGNKAPMELVRAYG